jgi:hypothetical protein
MVALPDHGALMDKFLALPMPRMFMYGQQNASLSNLPTLRAQGVRVAEIPHCGQIPLYSNPALMWRGIADSIASTPP